MNRTAGRASMVALPQCPLCAAGVLHNEDEPLLSRERLLGALALWAYFRRAGDSAQPFPLMALLLFHRRELARVRVQGECFAHATTRWAQLRAAAQQLGTYGPAELHRLMGQWAERIVGGRRRVLVPHG